MGLWDDFLGVVKGVGKDIAQIGTSTTSTVVGNVQGAIGAGALNPPSAQPSIQNLNQAAQADVTALTPGGVTTPGTAPAAGSDLLLRAAAPIGNLASQYVNRPISTAELLLNKNNPDVEAGASVAKTLKDTYDRSAKVSPFQALTQTPIWQDTPLGQFSDTVLKEGKVDVKGVNLWNDQDIKKNYVNNPLGSAFTGLGDFVESNVTFGAVSGAVGKVASVATKAAGLSTDINGVADLDKLNAEADAHLQAIATNNVQGAKSPFGAVVQRLANSTDSNDIVTQLRNLGSNNEYLPALIKSTNNPVVVKNILLADKGYTPAMNALMEINPDDAWVIGDTNNLLKGHAAVTGSTSVPNGTALKNTLNAHDASVASIPAHQDILNAFLDPNSDTAQKVASAAIKPISPVIGGKVIASAKDRLADIGQAMQTRDFEGLGGISERVLGGGLNKPVTKLIRFVGTSKPRGYITYNGLRQWDGVDELNSFFDDIPSFSNGTNDITTDFKEVDGKIVPQTIKASEYRRNAISQFIDAQGPTAKDAVIQKLNADMGKHLFYTHGVYDDKAIESFVNEKAGELNTIHRSLAVDGYGFDHADRLVTDPITQSQLADTRSMLPYGKLERTIEAEAARQGLGRAVAVTRAGATDATTSLFEAMNKIYNTSMLGRLAYIPKNGFAEPLTTAMISHGLGYLEDSSGTITNGIKNMKNRLISSVVKNKSLKDIKNINQVVSQKVDNLNQALHIRDNAYSEYQDAFNTDNLSPATKEENLARIKSDLRNAESVVNRIEADLSIASKDYAMSDKIPSVYGLRRRIDFLKDQGSVRYSSEIRTAEIELQKAIGNITTLSPDIAERNAALQKAYGLIDRAVKAKGDAEAEQAAIIARTEKYKQRYYSSDASRVMSVGGKQVSVPSLFDPNYLGDALKNDFSNADVLEQSFLNDTRIGSKQNIAMRKGPTGTVDVNSPLYYDELAYVINRQMRNDPLVQQVLRGDNTDSIMEWAKSNIGQRYLKQFGLEQPSDLRTAVQDRIDYVNRYIPDEATQRLASERTVTSLDLRKNLAEKQNILSPIHPLDTNYAEAATGGKLTFGTPRLDKALSAGLEFLMRAENPLRWLWSNQEFMNRVETKANLLAEQGVDITTEQMNALRQSAAREALQEHEKTFYTIRRQNRAVYAARTMLSFPAASFSAMQRFGHLAVKNPARFTGFLRNYYGMYSTFGVDKYGNPVNNPEDAAYILVPGTKDMSIFGEKGIKLSSKTLGWMVSAPGPSFLATFAVDKLLTSKPGDAEVVRQGWNATVGKIPGMDYDTYFPASVSTGGGLLGGFEPTFIKDAVTAFTGQKSNAQFLQTQQTIHNYLMTLNEMGLGAKPTLKQELAMTRQFYLSKAAWAFGSPFGASPQQNAPGQLFQDIATSLLKKFNGDYAKAQAAMLTMFGPSFPADRWLYKGSTTAAYINPSVEGYNRVYKVAPELTAQLTSLDPKTVDLLTADLNGATPSVPVQNYLYSPSATLPGGTKINTQKMSIAQYEQNLQVNRTWNLYSTKKAELLAAVQKAGYKRVADIPAAQAQWNQFVTLLGQSDPTWRTEYEANTGTGGGSNAFKYAQAMQDIVNNKTFMSKVGNNQFYRQMAFFIAQRNKAVAAYNNPTLVATKGGRTALTTAWNQYINEQLAGSWNPQMQQIVDRYFVNDNLSKGTN